MKLPSRHPAEASRSLLLFPLFSLLFHIALFLFLQVLSGPGHPPKPQEEEVIAMVDLESLKLPEETGVLPEKTAPAAPPTSIVVPVSGGSESDAGEAGKEGAPGDDPPPELGEEALSALPGPLGEGLPQATEFPEPLLEEDGPAPAEELPEAEVAQEGPEPMQAEAKPSPEIEAQEPSEAEPSGDNTPSPASDEAALALNEAQSEEASPETGAGAAPPADEGDPAPDEAGADEAGADEAGADEAGAGSSMPEVQEAPASVPAASPEPALPSELAESGQTTDSGEAPQKTEPLASAQKAPQEELQEAKASPPPRKKPSKGKLKKVGLLGLLGSGTGRKHRSGRRLLAKSRPPSKTPPVENKARFPRPSLGDAAKKVEGLRKRVLLSEEKRLMRRKPSARRRKRGIRIVHGSGRNYGVISAAIHQKKGRLTHVYNRLLQNDENLQGNLIIEFVISPQGRVIKSTILTSSIGNPVFERALMKEIRRWKFPAVKTGQTTVLYPLSFFPSG